MENSPPVANLPKNSLYLVEDPMSFAQGVPSVNTLINSSNTQVFGNTSTGTALSVQQLGSGSVMNVATSTGTSALFVNSSGQVGIGTNSVSTTLTVAGNITSSGYIQATGTGGGTTGSIFANSTNGLVVRGVAGSSYDFSILNPAGGSYVMAVPTGTNNSYFAGNVGIGYTSPQSTVHVQVGDVVPTASGNMATGMIISQASGGPAMCLGARTTGGNYTWIHSAYTNNSGVPAPLVLQPIGGNVGIGTASPSYGLDVYGATSAPGTIRAITASQGAGVAGAQLRLMEYTDSYGFAFQNINASRLGLLYYNGAPGVECMSVRRDNGWVGIGTANPGYPLQVNSSATGSTVLGAFLQPSLTTGGAGAGLVVGSAYAAQQAGSIYFLNYGTNSTNVFQLSMSSAGSSTVNITTTGVGIGTTSPSYTLDVNGQSRIGNPALITDASTVLRFTTNGGVSYIQSGTALTSYSVADIIFSGIFGNPEFMRIKSTGNVGIGTTNPGSTLTVNGSLSKSSGTFDIPHPTLPEPKRLVHSFIEGPRCDLMYRGSVALVNGTATVNIDSDCTSNAAHTMTQGTFEALCTNPVCFLQNDDSFDRVKGKVSGNLLTITCENTQSSDVVNWMVVAERKDLFIKQWNRTDPNGFLIPEYDSAS